MPGGLAARQTGCVYSVVVANVKKESRAEKKRIILIKYAEINSYIYRKMKKIVHGKIHL